MLSDARTLPLFPLISGYNLLHIYAQIHRGPGVESALLLPYETAGWNLMLKWITVSLAIGIHSFLQTIQAEGRESPLKCRTWSKFGI